MPPKSVPPANVPQPKSQGGNPEKHGGFSSTNNPALENVLQQQSDSEQSEGGYAQPT